MNSVATFTLTMLLAVGAASAAAAQQPASADTVHRTAPAYRRIVPDSLLGQVRVSEDSARGLALARVPNGTLQTLTLMRDHGKLVWSFVIKPQQKAGTAKVYVDAMDGTVSTTEQKAS